MGLYRRKNGQKIDCFTEGIEHIALSFQGSKKSRYATFVADDENDKRQYYRVEVRHNDEYGVPHITLMRKKFRKFPSRFITLYEEDSLGVPEINDYAVLIRLAVYSVMTPYVHKGQLKNIIFIESNPI